MVNEQNLIPKENYKKVEEMREIDYKVPSYEEFMKTYNEKEGINDNYQSEFDSYGDLRVKGTYYGPGFWDDFTDKKMFFLILVVAAFIGGILIYARIKSLNEIVREKTGSA